MNVWGKCAAIAATVVLCQGLARADLLPVQDPIFSSPLVSHGLQAWPYLNGTGWSTEGPVDPTYGTNINTIVWQNPISSAVNHIDNLISDDTVTSAQVLAVDPTPANWTLPYEGCASIGVDSAAASNAFVQTLSASYQPNQSYMLKVAVGHNYGNTNQIPAATAELRMELFYTDDGGLRHAVISADIFNDSFAGLSATHMLDFSTPLMLVSPADPAIGRPVGILLTTIGPAGGYFNVTNVRVEAVPEPASIALFLAGSALLLRRRRT